MYKNQTKERNMSNVTIYSGPNCPYCDRAKMLLKKKGAAYEEFNVRTDSAKFDEMLARSNSRKTIPQIFINGQHIGGCDDLYALDAEGKLDGLLNA
jgi:glutaredoxin 3